MNIKEILEKFEEDHQFRLSSKTLKAYLFAVNQLLTFTEEPFDKISKRDIRKWMKQLSENGYKTNSIKNRLIALKTFYKYCSEEEFIKESPAETFPFPKTMETIPRYLTREQIIQLRKLVEGNVMERALIEVLYATGVRISELRAMKKADINWSDRSILIPEGKGKKGRIVLFNPTCEEYLKAYLYSRTDNLPYVFVNKRSDMPIYINGVNKRFRYYSKQLGFYLSPHMLRHTFAAHLAQKGMPQSSIQTLLGHDHLHTTEIYTRLYNHARKEMYDEWM